MPIVLACCVAARGQDHATQPNSRAKINLFANVARKYLSEPEMDPHETPSVAIRVALQDGAGLSVRSAKHLLRNAETGELRTDRHLCVLSLDLIRRTGGAPDRLWLFSSEQERRLLIDYTEPYGFYICKAFAPKIALAFLDDQLLYFAELDLTPPSQQRTTSPNHEIVALSDLARKPFGTANYEPKFTIQHVTRHKDRWQVTVSIQGHDTYQRTYNRTARNSWVEVPIRYRSQLESSK